MKPQLPWKKCWIVPVLGFTLMVVSSNGWAERQVRYPDLEEFDEVEVFIEINDTDGDAGLQIFADGEDWRWAMVFDSNWRKVLQVMGQGAVQDQGLTEMFFESSEPSFVEQPLADFLERFGEGEYRYLARTNEGGILVGFADLTHDLPAAPVVLSPADEAVVAFTETLVIDWAPVMTRYPDGPAGAPIQIVRYEVAVEREDPEPVLAMSVQLPPSITQLTVPPEFLESGAEYKFEIIAREVSGNQTITEQVFETE